MGNGYYLAGKFHLHVVALYDATAELNQWRYAFEHASQALFDATDGQLQIGSVRVSVDSTAAETADIWLQSSGDDDFSGTTQVLGLGSSGTNVVTYLANQVQFFPLELVHEFGHYGLGLYDEYLITERHQLVPLCTRNPTGEGACIMEYGRSYGAQINSAGAVVHTAIVSEFCCDANHDALEPDNMQNALNDRESCWASMVRNYGDLVPPAGHPTVLAPAGHQNVEWIVADRDSLLVLAVDLIETDLLELKPDTLAEALEFELNLAELFRARAGWARLDRPVRLLAPSSERFSREAIQQAVAAWRQSSGEARALPEDWGPLFAQQPPSANPNLLLLSSRPATDRRTADAWIQSLRPHGVRLFCLSLGQPKHPASLQHATHRTLGRNEVIPLAKNAEQLPFRFWLAWSELITAMVGHHSSVAREIALLPSHQSEADPARPRQAAERPEDADRQSGRVLTSREFSITAQIEPGCLHATFIAVAGGSQTWDVELILPSGETLPLDSQTVISFVSRSKGLRAVVVRQPAAGVWRVRLRRPHANEPCPSAVEVYVDHAGWNPGFNWKLNPQSGELDLWMSLGAPRTIQGLQPPRARIYREDEFGRPLANEIITLDLQPNTLGDRRFPAPLPDPNGQFVGTIALPQPGLYRVEVRAVNSGTAFSRVETDTAGGSISKSIPEFTRLIHQQIVWQQPVADDVEDVP